MAVDKLQVLRRITESGLMAIVRTDSAAQASHIVEAWAYRGATAIEITFCNRYQIPYWPGAGTISV